MRAGHRMGTAFAAAAFAVGAWLAGAVPLHGQVIRGRVVDSESAEPVVLAYVGLLAPGSELVVATLADDDGHFSVRAPAVGSYFLYVTRTGYRAVVDGLFELGENGVFELLIGMRRAPIPVDPITVAVEGGVRDLRTVGFYERRDLGLGHFIEREEIQRVAIEDLTDALRGIPRFRVVTPAPSRVAPTGVLKPEILVRQGADYCSPTLFIDGTVVALGSRNRRSPQTAVRPDDFVDPSDVEAVEIYTSPARTPAAFEATGGCGAVLIWTRMR